MHEVVEEMIRMGEATSALVAAARRDRAQTSAAAVAVQRFRRRYIQVDVTLDFVGDAVNSRSSRVLRAALTTLDRLAVASMAPVLERAHKPVPQVLVYQDKGTGASILRAGVRLWAPGAVMPVAAIKIVRHNLYRPTSLFHETGHQVAHLTGWTPSMRDSIAKALSQRREAAIDVDGVGVRNRRRCLSPFFTPDTRRSPRSTTSSATPRRSCAGRSAIRIPSDGSGPRSAANSRGTASASAGPWNDLQRAMTARFPTGLADATVRAAARAIDTGHAARSPTRVCKRPCLHSAAGR